MQDLYDRYDDVCYTGADELVADNYLRNMSYHPEGLNIIGGRQNVGSLTVTLGLIYPVVMPDVVERIFTRRSCFAIILLLESITCIICRLKTKKSGKVRWLP